MCTFMYHIYLCSYVCMYVHTCLYYMMVHSCINIVCIRLYILQPCYNCATVTLNLNLCIACMHSTTNPSVHSKTHEQSVCTCEQSPYTLKQFACTRESFSSVCITKLIKSDQQRATLVSCQVLECISIAHSHMQTRLIVKVL